MLATGLSLTAKTLARRSSRRAALAAASAGAALFGARAAAQEATPVTNAGMGSNALEFVGTIQQRGLEFSLLAYVTHIAEVDRTVLFGGADPFARSEATAAITMVGNAMATSRSILQNIFVINAEGTVDFYLGDGGNSFDDPDTFSSGALLASSSVQIQNIINVQAPQQGIAQGVGDLVLNTVESMPLIGSLSSFAPGIRLRLSFTGQGTLHDPETLEATILVAGNGVALA